MRKRWQALVLAALVVLALGGCTSAGTASRGGGFRVGLVTDAGKIDDKSFNQSIWEGLQAAQRDVPGITEIKYIESIDPKDYDKNIAQFADAGYDVVVTVGFVLTDATYSAARRYPNTRFIGVDQFLARDDRHAEWPLPNLVGIVFDDDKAGFLAGALAGLMTRSGTIGAVLATDAVPPVWRFGEGYKAGAKYANPAVNVVVVFHNDVGIDKTFNDPEWGKTTAQVQVDRGADVIFGAGGKTGNGALIGTVERGAYAIGVDSDQWYTVPEARKGLLSSAMKLLTPSTAQAIRTAKEGTFSGGLHTGPVGLAPFHALDGEVPEPVKARLLEIDRGLADGSIKTGVPPSKS